MISKRERIVSAIMTALSTVPGVDGRIYRSQADPNPRELTPFVAVQWTSEQTDNETTVQLLGRVLTVEVSIYTRDDTPDQAADAIAVEAHQRITADPTLGGLAIDVMLDDANVEIIPADFPAARVTHNYRIRFRHLYGDMTT